MLQSALLDAYRPAVAPCWFVDKENTEELITTGLPEHWEDKTPKPICTFVDLIPTSTGLQTSGHIVLWWLSCFIQIYDQQRKSECFVYCFNHFLPEPAALYTNEYNWLAFRIPLNPSLSSCHWVTWPVVGQDRLTFPQWGWRHLAWRHLPIGVRLSEPLNVL